MEMKARLDEGTDMSAETTSATPRGRSAAVAVTSRRPAFPVSTQRQRGMASPRGPPSTRELRGRGPAADM
eukprot:6533202-Prymnesium_polylepis.1